MKGYRHINYFLAAMLWDMLVISISLFAFYSNGSDLWVVLPLSCSIWLLVNFIHFPSSNRRYVSYIHAYYDILIPFVLYTMVYVLFLTLAYPDWKLTVPFLRYFILLFGFILIDRFIFVFALRIYRSLGYGTSNYLLVGSSESTSYMQKLFDKRPENGYLFVDAFDWPSAKLDQWIRELQTEPRKVDEVYVFPSKSQSKRTSHLIENMDDLGINVYLIPFDSTRHINFYNFRRINQRSIDAIEKGPLRRGINRFGKRLFDVAFSSLVCLLLLSWLIPILGVLIRLDSKGPIFYIQQRAGRREKCIAVLS